MNWLKATLRGLWPLIACAMASVLKIALDYPSNIDGWTLIAAIALGANCTAILFHSMNRLLINSYQKLIDLQRQHLLRALTLLATLYTKEHP